MFHCTDISNAVSILCQGELLSRGLAETSGQLQRDIASSEVIAQTDPQWTDYVRLYFRPRTPTQYRNEGFRPVGQRALASHCPVPIYLIFDSLSILSRADCRFSEGNMAATGAASGGDVAFLKQIPFELVYHDTRLGASERSQIVYHRNAEALVPQRMGLDNLRFIGCRSHGEYETLLHLLPPDTRSQWVDKIGVRPNLRLFNREWTFVERVEMSEKQLTFRFNPSSKTPGPFNTRVELTDPVTEERFNWRHGEYLCDSTLALQVSQLPNPHNYTVRLFLDDNLAFANGYQTDDLPF